ncbi:hypothetical protein SS05631_a45920 (plasmid) [Sinorhizobium sp. CCBAU 05631]|nr:hypothetical protein SS05631_a45920 [Sinorhizobium sp. CCBAU 05631]
MLGRFVDICKGNGRSLVYRGGRYLQLPGSVIGKIAPGLTALKSY